MGLRGQKEITWDSFLQFRYKVEKAPAYNNEYIKKAKKRPSIDVGSFIKSLY